MECPQESDSIAVVSIAGLAVDIWKAGRRARSENAIRTVAAVERIEDRLSKLEIEVIDLTGLPYDPDMRVTVLDQDGKSEPFSIGQCVSPAIYHRKVLVLAAEVVIFGADANGKNG
jgi:hypothetical protein